MAGESQSLYRKYRPRSFDEDELVGQEAVARTLRNAIQTDRVAHAYLFCGPRGTGKTSTARLLAKAVNCEHPEPSQRPCNECRACRIVGLGENRSLDIIEIDAASNRGIDDIRDLREKINFAPSELTYKFYIIDEVHQLSEAASNALLKTLEEPPRHAKFVLATTDPQKMLETIVSRCQMFRFRRIPLDRMVARLRHVCEAEGVQVDDDALALVARQGTGSLRDALGLLDKLMAYGEATITIETVRRALGIHGDERVVALVDAALDGELATALTTINAVMEDGVEPRLFTQQVVEYLRELLMRLAGAATPAAGLSPVREAAQERQAATTSLPVVADLVQRLSAIDYALERGAYGSLPLELALVETVLARQERPRQLAPALEADRTPAAGAPRPMRVVPERPATAPPPVPLPSAGPGEVAHERETAPTRQVSASEPVAEAAAPGTVSAEAGLVLDQLGDIWQRVVRDMNAHHKRVHALLRNAEPLALDGDTLVLAAAYEFHYKQLSQEAMRSAIEESLARHAGRHYSLRCVLAAEADQYRARIATQAASVPAASEAPDGATPSEPVAEPSGASASGATEPLTEADVPVAPEADEARLRAAMNIFNARPV